MTEKVDIYQEIVAKVESREGIEHTTRGLDFAYVGRLAMIWRMFRGIREFAAYDEPFNPKLIRMLPAIVRSKHGMSSLIFSVMKQHLGDFIGAPRKRGEPVSFD